MKPIISHMKLYVLRGLLASIPVLLSVFAIQFFYVLIDKRVMGILDNYIGFRIPGLGFLLVIFFLYIVGIIVSNYIGKKIMHIVENLMTRIPIIKTTYQVGKQISDTLSLPERQLFKKAVLVEYFNPGTLVTGFVIGDVTHPENNEKYLKIFIPTVPNPTSGSLVLMKESQVIDPGWSVEETMKMVVSGGLIGPDTIGKKVPHQKVSI